MTPTPSPWNRGSNSDSPGRQQGRVPQDDARGRGTGACRGAGLEVLQVRSIGGAFARRVSALRLSVDGIVFNLSPNSGASPFGQVTDGLCLDPPHPVSLPRQRFSFLA